MRNLGRISLETSESGRTDADAHWKTNRSMDGPQPLIDFIAPVSLRVYFIDGSLLDLNLYRAANSIMSSCDPTRQHFCSDPKSLEKRSHLVFRLV